MHEAVKAMNDAYLVGGAGVFGWLCGNVALQARLTKKYGYYIASSVCAMIAVTCALMAGCITLQRGWDERQQELTECYRQEGPTCLNTARRTAERWGGVVIKVGGRLHTTDGFTAQLEPSTDGMGHAFVLCKEHSDYWEVKDSNHGRLILYKSELDKVVWSYDEH